MEPGDPCTHKDIATPQQKIQHCITVPSIRLRIYLPLCILYFKSLLVTDVDIDDNEINLHVQKYESGKGKRYEEVDALNDK